MHWAPPRPKHWGSGEESAAAGQLLQYCSGGAPGRVLCAEDLCWHCTAAGSRGGQTHLSGYFNHVWWVPRHHSPSRQWEGLEWIVWSDFLYFPFWFAYWFNLFCVFFSVGWQSGIVQKVRNLGTKKSGFNCSSLTFQTSRLKQVTTHLSLHVLI